MGQISDDELRAIVERIVRRTMGAVDPAAMHPPPSSAVETTKTTDPSPANPAGANTVAIGCDHGGFDLKELLKKELEEKGFRVLDCGTDSKEAVDYPDLAEKVALAVSQGKAWRGICIDGAGIGSCMVANKVPGVRAAMAYDLSSALNSREHNDANVLTLGAGLIGINLAKQIMNTWLTTEFGGGRHARRIEKIVRVEKTYLKG